MPRCRSKPACAISSSTGWSTGSRFLRPTPNESVRAISSIAAPASRAAAGMSVRTAQLPQAMSNPTPAGMIFSRSAMTPPMGME